MAAALLVFGSGLAMHAAQAQPAGIQRTDLLQQDIGAPGREVVQVRVDFGPAASAAKHSHPGEEIAYVLEGALEYELEGRAPVTLKAGEALFIPAGTAHSARNVGSGKASELATYIVRKGAPLVVPGKSAPVGTTGGQQ
jgi:quercetin dioxygenase-like cupin family protein